MIRVIEEGIGGRERKNEIEKKFYQELKFVVFPNII